VLVKNRNFIENNKNPTFLGNFIVSAICGSIGGAVNIFDITPSDDLIKLHSNEYSPLDLYWFTKTDLTDYDEIHMQRQHAMRNSKIFALTLNSKLFYLFILSFKSYLNLNLKL
jgi:hypothetical protein